MINPLKSLNTVGREKKKKNCLEVNDSDVLGLK